MSERLAIIVTPDGGEKLVVLDVDDATWEKLNKNVGPPVGVRTGNRRTEGSRTGRSAEWVDALRLCVSYRSGPEVRCLLVRLRALLGPISQRAGRRRVP
jgi:hypothetical protein